ncbi:MAG TPA: DUF4124 domain-containing protein [Methylomirabilota bacterium]|nr:DUF4124 domain-containing protein [Methylomirabilota bacterium]
MRRVGLLHLVSALGALALLTGAAAAQERPRSHDRLPTTAPNQVVAHPRFSQRIHPAFLPRHRAPHIPYPYSSYFYGPPMVYEQPSSYLIAPPAPIPSVIEYPNGRYELRGDGVTTPFRWVWIPKPPPGPPEAPPAAPPAPPEPPVAAKPSAERRPASPTAVYRWTDEEGVTHWTDQLENIPERYRAKVQRPTLAGR